MLVFFYLLYFSHNKHNKQIRNCHKLEDLVDKVDYKYCINIMVTIVLSTCFSYYQNFFSEFISSFHNIGNLQNSDLSRLANKKWYTNVLVNNVPIVAF